MEGVANLKYMGQTLDQTDDDWPVVMRNIMRPISVWGNLWALLRRGGADPRVSEMFYRVVAQAALLFGFDTWVLLTATKRKVEGANMGFLKHITGK